ncbi:MAG: TRAP transporter small permease [Deltaproteobacteria bacterium]|nr:TRAP transporter small permease [Deltaproteobacteria bacterium]
MCLIVFDIFSRLFLNMSIEGTPIFARNAVVGMTFLALPWLTWERKHLRSDLVLSRTKGMLKKILEGMAGIVTTVMLSLYSYALLKPTINAFRFNETDVEGTTFIPLAPFYVICLLGCVLGVLGSLSVFRRKAKAKDMPEAQTPLTGFEI